VTGRVEREAIIASRGRGVSLRNRHFLSFRHALRATQTKLRTATSHLGGDILDSAFFRSRELTAHDPASSAGRTTPSTRDGMEWLGLARGFVAGLWQWVQIPTVPDLAFPQVRAC
jgi:hypothetical protein